MWDEFYKSVWPYLVGAAHIITTCLASAHVVLTKRDVRAAIGWVGIIWLTPSWGRFCTSCSASTASTEGPRMRRGRGRATARPACGRVVRRRGARVFGDDDTHLAPLTNYVAQADAPAAARWQPRDAARRRHDGLRRDAGGHRRAETVGRPADLYLRQRRGRQAIRRGAGRGPAARGVQVRVLIDAVGAALHLAVDPPAAAHHDIRVTPCFCPR